MLLTSTPPVRKLTNVDKESGCYLAAKLNVVGHTDSTDNLGYNIDLSERRARSLVEVFVKKNKYSFNYFNLNFHQLFHQAAYYLDDILLFPPSDIVYSSYYYHDSSFQPTFSQFFPVHNIFS